MTDNRAEPLVSDVEEALALMAAGDRALFLMHRHEGLDYSVIARRLGLSLCEVERRMARAMVHLDWVVEAKARARADRLANERDDADNRNDRDREARRRGR